MITVTGVHKTYGSQVLFSNVDLQLNAGKCIGIVGANGSGKSTLLKILSGEESHDQGTVRLQKNLCLGVLNQNHFAYEHHPIIDVVMMGNKELWKALVQREEILQAEDFDLEKYSATEDTILRLDGYGFEAKAAAILVGLNIKEEQHRKPLSVLSGGYKLRVLLAQTLASSPDILFLDEPTNHLDILSIDWLEGFLLTFKGLALVVSHDHHFLNKVCNQIIDVDYQTATTYRGNYNKFLQQKTDFRERQEKAISKREKEIEDHKSFINRFKAKATKARQANSRVKRMAKIEIERLPTSSRRHPKFSFIPKRPSGKVVVEVKGVEKKYDQHSVLNDVGFTINRGDRVAIIGPNGIGKSTLLKIMMSHVRADKGTTEWGYETHIGYFSQDHKDLLTDPKQTVMSSLWDDCSEAPIGFVLGKLAEVLFHRDDCEKKLKNLSGGEAARLMMVKLAVKKPNVLVLDEPTNHLDLEGVEALATGLQAFTGTIIFVSHNRWLVDKIASRIIEITPQGIEDYLGTYSEFLSKNSIDHLDKKDVLAQSRKKHKKKKS